MHREAPLSTDERKAVTAMERVVPPFPGEENESKRALRLKATKALRAVCETLGITDMPEKVRILAEYDHRTAKIEVEDQIGKHRQSA